MIPQDQPTATISHALPQAAVTSESATPDPSAIPATRSRLRMKQNVRQNRVIIIGAGLLVVAFLLFVAVSVPRSPSSKPIVAASSSSSTHANLQTDDLYHAERSVLPIVDSRPPKPAPKGDSLIDEEAVEHTASQVTAPSKTAHSSTATGPQTLASVPPFPEQWQAPPYPQRPVANQENSDKAEEVALQKSSFAFVRNASAATTNSVYARGTPELQPELSLGLPTGTRLRARLESAVSTGLRAPVIAAIEYNYERGGVIVVPAGARAIGHIQQADRSGYMTIEFDSLLMPDESTVSIQAVATDLNLAPPKGKVEGKNGRKNFALRSLSGIGQVGALLVGRGSLDQPLSEGDMLRERVSNNIGEASDEQISRLALSDHLIVTIPANTSIYVILEKATESDHTSHTGSKNTEPSTSTNVDDLRQLLQLQKELNHQQ